MKKTAALEEKQLAVVETSSSGPIALPEDLQGFTGFENLDPSKFVIPRIKVGQLMSREGTAGKFRMNLTGDEYDELDMLIIKAEPGRVWMDKDMTKDKPLCRSFDGLVPDPQVENPPSDRCIMKQIIKGKSVIVPVCPNAKWGDNRERPPCDETYNCLSIFSQDYLPFWLTLHGTAIKPLMGYISAIALRRAPLWQYSTTATLQEVVGAKGKYYVPRFSRPEPISKELESEIVEIVTGLRFVAIRSTFEAEDVGGEDGGMDGLQEGGEDPPDWMQGDGGEAPVDVPPNDGQVGQKRF
jgi:hypothetical protein